MIRRALLVAALATQVFSVARAQTSDLQLRIGLARPGGGHAVTSIPLETYIARVLAGEAARDSAPAALEALAITIRTFALVNRSRHRADGFDLCDETHCQVMRTPTAATERAAAATAGRVLWYRGELASVYYSASCGGHTERPSEVWPKADDPAYLPSKPDDGCEGVPAWTSEMAEADLFRALRAGGFSGDRLRDLRVASRNGSGRVAQLRLEGLQPSQISGQDLRVVVGRTLGWQHIKSTTFDLTRVGDRYRFAGRGSGHGVGMCVIGSVRLAAAGESAVQIINRYYPGVTIAPISGAPAPLVVDASPSSRPVLPSPPAPPAPVAPVAPPARASAAPARPAAAPVVPEVLLSLPDGDEGERGVLTQFVAQARTNLAGTLGVAAPRVTLRFHPTVDSYEQATTQPWFTSAAVVNGEIHLLPPTVLRDRGTLERTIRHELVRMMANAALSGRPLWVREGAAIYFAGQPTVPAERDARPALPPKTSCPDEAELLRPVSAGALTSAFARAHACFARQIAQGRSWRDVR